MGSLSGAAWVFLEARKDLSHPEGFLQDAHSPPLPFAELAFSSIPVILRGKAGKPKYLHNFVAWAEIPVSGLWLQSQAMAEGNKGNVALLLI